ncbi:MAG: ADP-forming succinate--CoA ligase subunit beta [Methylococcales bacterium]|jgi:succinyl-CoA synthetase beta subunit|nr:ADP-forming succinate--CoA ligase subunit beta [Methylococcales bacterium]MBT7409087.1 ADP-forming succinate--CoA ligase subunit beta [Methylococcales bacterium]
MNLHEFQSKQLFSTYHIPVPVGEVADSGAMARKCAEKLGGESWVVKAQVHAGGRGKAGGVKLVKSLDDVEKSADAMLGTVMITKQTGADGLPIKQVLVEQVKPIERELYLGLLVDRACKKVVFMASSAGGMDIEEVAATTPEKIITIQVDPAAGLQGYQCRKVAFGLGLEKNQIKQLSSIMSALYQLFVENDASLIEINPLIVNGDGDLIALDAKINLDDNALYRHKNLAEMRDISQEDAKEAAASEHELNYITLDGSIGCMVNGAGLAMATMDVVQLHGGEPANFLDVGGGTTAARVAEAFKLILSDGKVKAVLVNIFGGIVRCDLIAEGIISAVKEIGVKVPVVVRLEGTNVEKGREMLKHSGLDIIAADDLTDGAKRVVASVS